MTTGALAWAPAVLWVLVWPLVQAHMAVRLAVQLITTWAQATTSTTTQAWALAQEQA
jgi:hypothetical protein